MGTVIRPSGAEVLKWTGTHRDSQFWNVLECILIVESNCPWLVLSKNGLWIHFCVFILFFTYWSNFRLQENCPENIEGSCKLSVLLIISLFINIEVVTYVKLYFNYYNHIEWFQYPKSVLSLGEFLHLFMLVSCWLAFGNRWSFMIYTVSSFEDCHVIGNIQHITF
jgi:hypothetical protein